LTGVGWEAADTRIELKLNDCARALGLDAYHLARPDAGDLHFVVRLQVAGVSQRSVQPVVTDERQAVWRAGGNHSDRDDRRDDRQTAEQRTQRRDRFPAPGPAAIVVARRLRSACLWRGGGGGHGFNRYPSS
jgi:hypothetical protein